MLRNNVANLIMLLALIPGYLFSQDYGTGILLDEELYKNAKSSALLTRGDFKELPSEHSLFKYTPSAGYQGTYSTCAGWAVSYYGRTILEAIKFSWGDELINLNTFSPSFVYNKVRVDSSCSKGVSLLDAIRVLKDYGSVKMYKFGYDCFRHVGEKELKDAEKYRIKDFRVIFKRNDLNKTRIVKKSLAENKPVIIAINCPYSFSSAGEFWNPSPEDNNNFRNGHALTVIGYNDTINGGSFHVMNSWGNVWGKNGTTWIRYKDFEKITFYAFDLIDNPVNTKYELSGKLDFIDEQGEKMLTDFNNKYFLMKKPFRSGTKFQVYLSNNNPAYVYVFGTDLKKNCFKIFPSNNNISALLPYKKNNIAIPDEYHYNMLDEVKGKSYYVFLCSKNELNIDKFIEDVSKSKSSIYDLLVKYFGSQHNDGNVFTGGDSLKFKSRKDSNLIYILVEFKHI